MKEPLRYYGGNHLHYLTTSTDHRGRIFDSERFKGLRRLATARRRRYSGTPKGGWPRWCKAAARIRSPGTTRWATVVASSTAGTALSLAFSYLGNGNVSTVTNNRDSNRTESFTYDALNRVATAQTATTAGACWGQSYGYDRYGNLTGATVTQCSAPMLSLSVNAANNRVSNAGFSYDGAGNETADGTYTYTWDAESHVKSAAGVTYTYDGDGQRVKKSNGTLYWNGLGAAPLAETDLAGNTTNEYIFFGGSRIARRDSAGNVSYYFGDNLGSSRSITTSTGGLCYEADFYPFGGEKVITSTCGENYKFTGMERDSETGNDHTLFRQYASNLGRWLSPDPLGGNVLNPQSLNRYAYVLNNPTTFTDPLGLLEEICSADFGNEYTTTACSFVFSAGGDDFGQDFGPKHPGEKPDNPDTPGSTPIIQAAPPPPKPGPPKNYLDQLGCVGSQFIIQGFGNDDRAFATVGFNVAPFALAESPPAAFTALFIAGVFDINLALRIRAACSGRSLPEPPG